MCDALVANLQTFSAKDKTKKSILLCANYFSVSHRKVLSTNLKTL